MGQQHCPHIEQESPFPSLLQGVQCCPDPIPLLLWGQTVWGGKAATDVIVGGGRNTSQSPKGGTESKKKPTTQKTGKESEGVGGPGGHRPQQDPTVRGCSGSAGWGHREGGPKEGAYRDPHRSCVGAHAGMGLLGFTSTQHCWHSLVGVRPIHPPDPISVFRERSPPPCSPLQPSSPTGTVQPTPPTRPMCPFSLLFAQRGIFLLRFVFLFLGVPQHRRKRPPKQKGRPQEGVPCPRRGAALT